MEDFNTACSLISKWSLKILNKHYTSDEVFDDLFSTKWSGDVSLLLTYYKEVLSYELKDVEKRLK